MRRNVEIVLVNFLDRFRDDFARRDEHRAEHALLRFHAVRQRSVNIRRRSCDDLPPFAAAILAPASLGRARCPVRSEFSLRLWLSLENLLGIYFVSLAGTAGFVSRLFGRSFRFWFLGGLDVGNQISPSRRGAT